MSMVAKTGRLIETSERNMGSCFRYDSARTGGATAAAATASTAATGPTTTVVARAGNRDPHPAPDVADIARDDAIAGLQSFEHFDQAEAVVRDAGLERGVLDGVVRDAIGELRAAVRGVVNRVARNGEHVAYRTADDLARGESAAADRAGRIRDFHVYRDRTCGGIDRRAHARDPAAQVPAVGAETNGLSHSHRAPPPRRNPRPQPGPA